MTLPNPTEKAFTVETMFDRISPRYDLMNRLMTFGIDQSWRRLTVRRLGIGAGDRVLDLACGTGDLAAEAASLGAKVIGIDFSSGMLAVAKARAVKCRLVRADALRLPLRNASVDAITSGFALRNFTELEVVFAECARVLRPGGGLAFLEVDIPARRLVRAAHGLYFSKVVPLMGRLLSDGYAYSYLPSSVVYLPDEGTLAQMLQRAGFTDLRKEQLMLGAAQIFVARRRDAKHAE